MKKVLCLLVVLFLLIPCVCFAAGEDKNFTVIRINEFMASNGKSVLVDKNGVSADWIELYNPSDNDIDLEGLCLSDGKKSLEKFIFPKVILPAHGYIIVFCSGEEDLSAEELHTAFKLNADEGEKVVISYEGVILDIVEFGPQEKNISMALDGDGKWQKTSSPTPGSGNVITEEK